MDDLAGLGAMTMMVDILRSFGWGKSGATGVVAGPAIGELTQTADDLLRPTGELFRGEEEDWLKNTVKGIFNTASRNLPGSGIARTFGVTRAVKNALFSDKTTSDEFKETLTKEEESNFENLTDLERKRDKASKKALETKDPDDVKEYQKLKLELETERKKNQILLRKKNIFDKKKDTERKKLLGK